MGKCSETILEQRCHSQHAVELMLVPHLVVDIYKMVQSPTSKYDALEESMH